MLKKYIKMRAIIINIGYARRLAQQSPDTISLACNV